jgi:hypothetical protein
MTTMQFVIGLIQIFLLVFSLVYVGTAFRKISGRMQAVRRCEVEIETMKARLGQRMAELRLEQEAICRKRGASAWFARQIGWHVRPDQWGALAEQLPAADFDDLLDVFDASTDLELRGRMTASSRALAVMRKVVDDKQNVSLDRLERMLQNPQRRDPRSMPVVKLIPPGPGDGEGHDGG